MSDSQRNFLILGALAILGVMFSGAFTVTAGTVSLIVNILFTICIIAFLVLLYRRNSGTIGLMKSRYRLQLQIAAVLLLGVLLSISLPIPGVAGWYGFSGIHTLVFFILLALGIYGIYDAWRNRYA